MDRATLREIGKALGEAETAVEKMISFINPDTTDADEEELLIELTQLDGTLVEFDRYLSSFSLPTL